MIPTEEELIKFIKSKKFVNFSLIAKHFNIKNTTVSDILKDLEEKNLIDIINAGGSKMVQVKENKMKKRGQVTLYVILGLIVLIALIAVFSLQNYIIKNEFEREQEKIQVAEEFKPVKNYFDSCIQSIALDGARSLGLQGGYLTIPKDELPVNPALPFSNRLQIFGNDALEVPYWFYETANGIQKIQVPTVQDMQNDLQNFISTNINNCLNNFTSFEDYEVSGFDNIKTEVQIENDKAFVTVLSNLKVNYKGLTQDFDKFLIIVDVPLGKLYNKAKEILEKENSEYFFEQKTIDMLVLYDQIPYTGLNLNCNPRMWATENVKQDLKKVLKANIEIVNPNAPRKYFKYDINPENININFRYDENWPLFLEANGGEQVLKENSIYGENNPAASFLRTLFCLNNYHFIYDIKYPILVNLNDNNFDFQYATMVIIANNQPRENRLGIEAPVNSNPVICKSGSVEIIIDAIDQYTNKEIENADVKFACVGTVCELGKTSQSGLKTKVPACLNAEIKVEKDGYNKAQIITDTTDGGNLFLYLKPKYKKNIEVKVIDENTVRTPLSSEFVSFTLTNSNDKTQISFSQDSKEIELSEGEYEVSSYIIRNYSTKIKLQKQELQYCADVPRTGILGVLGFTKNECTKTEIPETDLEQVLVGGAKFNLTLTQDQIISSNTITFYTLFNKVPSNVQELTDLYNLIGKNKDSTNFRFPLIK